LISRPFEITQNY